jgi:hypothetical protein
VLKINIGGIGHISNHRVPLFLCVALLEVLFQFLFFLYTFPLQKSEAI